MFDIIQSYKNSNAVSSPRHFIEKRGFHNPAFLLPKFLTIMELKWYN
jgi:hypothetical protein